ncbi:hypothetical protein CLV77_2266 [Brevirhabdus pacifica]|nr:hypothetical protein [Brevirhabdus pacifica]PJJ85398.1 hypothetical protein CLV77_2266 [Brevirhabdus pacifica]
MKSFLLALVAITAIAWGANEALEHAGFSTRELTTGAAVRNG